MNKINFTEMKELKSTRFVDDAYYLITTIHYNNGETIHLAETATYSKADKAFNSVESLNTFKEYCGETYMYLNGNLRLDVIIDKVIPLTKYIQL